MDFIDPRKTVMSPHNGLPVKPKLHTYVRDNKEIVEAHYIDPTTGLFLHKGVVSVKDLPEKK